MRRPASCDRLGFSMRLTPTQIERLAGEILRVLQGDGVLRVRELAAATEAVRSSIEEDLRVEDRLDDEVRDILERYEHLMRTQNIAYHDMFKKVKRQLVRDRKLIL